MGSALHGLEAVACELPDLVDGVAAQVGDLMLFEVSPDRLNWIEFRSIGRQSGNGQRSSLILQPRLDLAAAVDRCTIPDDQQRALDLTLERSQKVHDLLRANGSGKETKVELPEGQAGDDRELFPVETVLEHGRSSTQAPSTRHTRALRQTGLVYEDDGAAFAPGFFLSAGQVCRFQRAMSSSLRWVARFSGFWQEKPSRRSKCHKWPVLYCTPKRFAISLPIRGKVHSSVGYPQLMAPAIRSLLNSRSCSPSSWRGRPNVPRLSESCPPVSKRCSHAATVWRVTPSCRATSDFDSPRANSLAPLSRRFSNALKSRLCFIVAPRNEHKQINAFICHQVDSHLYGTQYERPCLTSINKPAGVTTGKWPVEETSENRTGI